MVSCDDRACLLGDDFAVLRVAYCVLAKADLLLPRLQSPWVFLHWSGWPGPWSCRRGSSEGRLYVIAQRIAAVPLNGKVAQSLVVSQLLKRGALSKVRRRGTGLIHHKSS